MIQLSTVFNEEEQKVLDLWKDDKLIVMGSVDFKCYLLNMNGEFEYELCFGKTTSYVERHQRYNMAVPHKMIQYYHYYLLENQDELGEWYIGEMQKNGAVEFYSCCESLEYAFESL